MYLPEAEEKNRASEVPSIYRDQLTEFRFPRFSENKVQKYDREIRFFNFRRKASVIFERMSGFGRKIKGQTDINLKYYRTLQTLCRNSKVLTGRTIISRFTGSLELLLNPLSNSRPK